VRERDGRFELLKGLDETKDQSYFLHRLTQEQLSKALFPVGELRKTEVRRLAAEIGLPNAAKKDSTGICFIGERPFREFLNRYIQKEPGPIKDERGRVIGQHQGCRSTRWGSARGWASAASRPRARNAAAASTRRGSSRARTWTANTLWVVQGHDHPWLQSLALDAADASWIAGEAPAGGHVRLQDPLPPGRCALPPGRECQRRLPPGLPAAAVGRDAGAVGRAVRRRGVPGRRGDRGCQPSAEAGHGAPGASPLDRRHQQLDDRRALQHVRRLGGQGRASTRGPRSQNGMSSSMSSKPDDGLPAAGRRGGRRGAGRRGGGAARRAVVAAAVVVAARRGAHAFALAQHLHLVGADLGGELLDAVLVGPLAGAQAAFDVDLPSPCAGTRRRSRPGGR
jgi:hypothetical protein